MKIKVKCKTCGAEKSKFSTCKNPEHGRIIDERLKQKFGIQVEYFCANCKCFRLQPHNCGVSGSFLLNEMTL